MGIEKIFDIVSAVFDKCVPGRMEQYESKLADLEVKYAEALTSGKDTEAAAIRVQMKELRRRLGVKDD